MERVCPNGQPPSLSTVTVCNGAFTAAAPATLLISAVADAVYLQVAPAPVALLAVTQQTVSLSFSDGTAASFPVPDAALTLGPGLPAATGYTGTWNTTAPLAAGSASLITPTFLAAGAYPLAAGKTVTQTTFAATFSMLVGPSISLMEWHFNHSLYVPGFDASAFNALEISSSGPNAGTVTNSSFTEV